MKTTIGHQIDAKDIEVNTQPFRTHFVRRWYYALWCALLGLSVTALILWETPRQSGAATLALSLNHLGFPLDCRAQAWIGPHDKWLGTAWNGEGSWIELPAIKGTINYPIVPVPVGYRRWVKDYIPGQTHVQFMHSITIVGIFR